MARTHPSDTGRTEIRYDSLSAQDIASRIRVYEKKYGMRFSKYASGFSCDNASPDEMTDYMDGRCSLLSALNG